MSLDKTSKPSEEQLRGWYLTDQLPIHRIAARCGAKPATVSRWLDQFEIPRRTHSEVIASCRGRDFRAGDTVALTGTNRRARVVADHDDRLTLQDENGGAAFIEHASKWGYVEPETPPLPHFVPGRWVP